MVDNKNEKIAFPILVFLDFIKKFIELDLRF